MIPLELLDRLAQLIPPPRSRFVALAFHLSSKAFEGWDRLDDHRQSP